MRTWLFLLFAGFILASNLFAFGDDFAGFLKAYDAMLQPIIADTCAHYPADKTAVFLIGFFISGACRTLPFSFPSMHLSILLFSSVLACFPLLYTTKSNSLVYRPSQIPVTQFAFSPKVRLPNFCLNKPSTSMISADLRMSQAAHLLPFTESW